MANKFTWIGTIVLTAAISNISVGIALADRRVSVRLCTGTDLQVCGEPVGVGHG